MAPHLLVSSELSQLYIRILESTESLLLCLFSTEKKYTLSLPKSVNHTHQTALNYLIVFLYYLVKSYRTTLPPKLQLSSLYHPFSLFTLTSKILKRVFNILSILSPQLKITLSLIFLSVIPSINWNCFCPSH